MSSHCAATQCFLSCLINLVFYHTADSSECILLYLNKFLDLPQDQHLLRQMLMCEPLLTARRYCSIEPNSTRKNNNFFTLTEHLTNNITSIYTQKLSHLIPFVCVYWIQVCMCIMYIYILVLIPYALLFQQKKLNFLKHLFTRAWAQTFLIKLCVYSQRCWSGDSSKYILQLFSQWH